MSFSFQRFFAVLKARNKEFYRDKGSLAWTFLFPLLIVISFGYMFNLDSTDFFKFAIIDENSKNFDFPNTQLIPYKDFESAKEKLRIHKIDGILLMNNQGIIEFWTNTTSPKNKIVKLIVSSIENKEENSNQIIFKEVSEKPIQYVEWLFPGLLAMNVMWMALWGVGWVIVRQRKMGILKRFHASPLTPLEYLMAQMVSRVFILWISGAVVFIGSFLIYPFAMKGSFFTIFIAYTAGSLALCGIGLIFAIRSSSDELVSGVLNMISFPMMFLSEVWFSLEGSPVWVKKIAYCLPLYHFSHSMRVVMNEGAGLNEISNSIFINLSYALIGLGLGSILFRWNSK